MENSYLEVKLQTVVDGHLHVSSHCSKKNPVLSLNVYAKNWTPSSAVVPMPVLSRSNIFKDALSSIK